MRFFQIHKHLNNNLTRERKVIANLLRPKLFLFLFTCTYFQEEETKGLSNMVAKDFRILDPLETTDRLPESPKLAGYSQ